MLFNSSEFVLFFVVFFVIYHLLVRSPNARRWVTIVGSVFFYATFSYKFIPVLAFTATADYLIARAIVRTDDKKRKKRLLALSVTLNLLVLGFFKYTNFAVESVTSFLGFFHVAVHARTFDIALPLGISFYTFQAISYTTDAYRGAYTQKTGFLPFLAALTFFPHLLAGPIVRSSFLVPQFETMGKLTWASARTGMLLVSWGFAKKVVADMLATVADPAFKSSAPLGILDAWTGALAFAGQLYGDFSGYTDMATGMAAILGFQLPPNFRLPYFSESTIDFWSRWHISFSTWLRDYLYMPLLRGSKRPYVSLMITWFLAGLWHGAMWTQVAYGVYWGLILVVTHWMTGWIPDSLSIDTPYRSVRVLKSLLTFYIVIVGFVIFRAQTMMGAVKYIAAMHVRRAPSLFTWSASLTLALVLLGLIACHVIDIAMLDEKSFLRRTHLLWVAAVIFVAFGITFGVAERSFIYFAF